MAMGLVFTIVNGSILVAVGIFALVEALLRGAQGVIVGGLLALVYLIFIRKRAVMLAVTKIEPWVSDQPHL
jgi:hypothetical protein